MYIVKKIKMLRKETIKINGSFKAPVNQSDIKKNPELWNQPPAGGFNLPPFPIGFPSRCFHLPIFAENKKNFFKITGISSFCKQNLGRKSLFSVALASRCLP